MPIARFKGKLIPEGFHVVVQGHPTVHWKNQVSDIHVDLDIAFHGSTVEVTCNLIRFDPQSQISLLILVAVNLAQGLLDLHCFQTGNAITAVLQKLELPDGRVIDLVPSMKEFVGLATAIDKEEDFFRVLGIALTDFEMLLALRDLADSIRYTHLAEINCARATESIRNYFIPTGGKREDGWEPMRRSLNIGKSYTQFITERSRHPRHGNRLNEVKNDPRILEAGKRAWTIMNRFLEYRKRGNQPLPESEFPLLD